MYCYFYVSSVKQMNPLNHWTIMIDDSDNLSFFLRQSIENRSIPHQVIILG